MKLLWRRSPLNRDSKVSATAETHLVRTFPERLRTLFCRLLPQLLDAPDFYVHRIWCPES